MVLPPSSLTTKPDADRKFSESKAASKYIATFTLCICCLGLAFASKISTLFLIPSSSEMTQSENVVGIFFSLMASHAAILDRHSSQL
ncbi:hypothetical protein F383_32621 [Gossypium arboreum]|uniref:Uncharacterized protein n=1 Tax=Gossypium arboreum TaxID=29729 RepID=A0A0B0MVX8_GOSAR|nr:hypothetical protein F383_32689 [Gossypium arboreum]KHG25686.1 hypothetical protein F383_32621 [Gossypium arboreum]